MIINYRKWPQIILVVSIVCSLACTENGDGPIGGLTTSDRDKAIELVNEANKDLQEIKKLYKANEDRVEDLKLAMRNKDIENAKKLADAAVYAINDGVRLGNSAVEKLAEAQRLDINETFSEYIGLKEDSLRQMIEAFELRRQIAISLRDGYDPENVSQRERVLEEFKQKEQKFKEVMKEAQDTSRKANELAKEAAQEDAGSR